MGLPPCRCPHVCRARQAGHAPWRGNTTPRNGFADTDLRQPIPVAPSSSRRTVQAKSVAFPEPVRGLCRVEAACPAIEARKMLSRRRLADAELARSRLDRTARDVDLEHLE